MTTAANLANGKPGSMIKEYSASGGYYGYSWDILYDRDSGVLWCMAGRSLEARGPDGSLIRKFTPAEIGDNVYSIAKILNDEGAYATISAPELPTGTPIGVKAAEDPDFIEDLSNPVLAGFAEGTLYKENGRVYVSEKAAVSLAEKLYEDEDVRVKSIAPPFEGKVDSGMTAAVDLTVPGRDLLAGSASSVRIMKIKGKEGKNEVREFKYVSKAGEYSDGRFAVLKGSEHYGGILSPNDTYTVRLFII
jgi:hypothetical protein